MKILVGMPSKDSWGGPISSEPPFVHALRKIGVDVEEENYVYGDKIKPTPILGRISRVWRTAFRFRKLLKNNSFDLVHLNSAFDMRTILRDTFSLFVMKPRQTCVFFKIHGSEAHDFFDANLAVRILIRYLSRKGDGFGVHTTQEISDFERLGFERNKLHLVKNVVTLSKVNGPAERAQKDPGECFKLLYVSRFVPKKCLLETIEACAILKNNGVQFTLDCLGDGETRSAGEEMARVHRLEEMVSFTGYLKEDIVASYFQSSDILVFPTKHSEGFPNVFFKAIVAGMPIVASEFRAVRDYLKDTENCLICKPEPEDIAQKIQVLIDDKRLRETMRRNNLEFGKLLTPDAVAREFHEIYETVVK